MSDPTIEVVGLKTEDQCQQILERIMESTPKLSDVLADPLLKDILRWHMIARYAPEHFLFLDIVAQFHEYILKKDSNGALATVREIDRLFCVDEALFELNLNVKQKKLISAMADSPPEDLQGLDANLFAPLVKAVHQDLSRSLSSLWNSSIFLSYVKHRDVLESLKGVGPSPVADALDTFRHDARAEMVKMVRSGYQSEEHLLVRRIFELSSPYTFEVCTGHSNTRVGYAKIVEGKTFNFFDLEGKLLLKVDATVFLNRQRLYMESNDIDSAGARPQRSNSCCGGAPPAEIPKKQASYVFFQGMKEGIGPIPLDDAKLWWKYHIIGGSTLLKTSEQDELQRLDSAQFRDIFEPGAPLEAVDPTQIV